MEELSENIKNIKTGREGDLTQNEVIIWLNTIYGYKSTKHISYTTLDILTIYINAQKILYTESKTFCEQKLYYLMIPTIIISAITGVFSFVFNNKEYSPLIIASISAFNSLLLALITYLKLDGKSEAHKMSAYQFEKIQGLCEFHCGKLLIHRNIVNSSDLHINDDISAFIIDIELKVKEIRETNQFILPEFIRYNFPYLTTTNIFSLVKTLQYDEDIEIGKLRAAINYVNSSRNIHSSLCLEKEKKEKLLYSIDQNIKSSENTIVQLIIDLRSEIDILQKKIDNEFFYLDQNIKNQNIAIDNVIGFGKNYLNIDIQIKEEILRYHNRPFKFSILNWLKT